MILEAMHLRVPVVASDTGGIPELVDHGRTGLLFPSGDIPALAEAIHRVLTEPLLARRLRDGARLGARRRTWEASGRAHLEMYRALTLPARRRTLLPAAG